MMNHRKHSEAAGFTLIEILIATTVLFLTLGAVAMVSNANNSAYRTGITNAQLESQVGIVIDRIVGELTMAGAETGAGNGALPSVVSGVGSAELSYSRADGIANGQVTWSPPRRIVLEYELGELDDGLDNNGNGLVDEGRLVLVEDEGGPNERRLVLTRWVSEYLEGEFPNGLDDNGNGMVDERGFCVERTAAGDESLLVRITLARREESGRLLRRTAQTSVRVRN
jgi:hypothetical protein